MAKGSRPYLRIRKLDSDVELAVVGTHMSAKIVKDRRYVNSNVLQDKWALIEWLEDLLPTRVPGFNVQMKGE